MVILHVKSKCVAAVILDRSFLIKIMLFLLILWLATPTQCNLFLAVAYLAFKKQNTLQYKGLPL